MLSSPRILGSIILSLLTTVIAPAQTPETIPHSDSSRTMSRDEGNNAARDNAGEPGVSIGGFARLSLPYFSELGARVTLDLRPGIVAASVEVSEISSLIDDCPECSHRGFAAAGRVEAAPIPGEIGGRFRIFTQARIISPALGYGGGIAYHHAIDDVATFSLELDATDFNHDFTGGNRRRTVIAGITCGLTVGI